MSSEQTLDAALEANIEQAKKLLIEVANHYSPATFANSFGAEDMVATDLICKFAPDIEIFSLDTGRLPQETHAVIQQAMKHYGREFKIYAPESADVEAYARKNGPDAFYDSVAMRTECCRVRKVLPLQRALKGKKAWVTGMRAEQSPTRGELPESEWDEGNGLQKFSPLSRWKNQDVWSYINHFKVPYNKLHDQFYASIGCAPCTRAISAGEDIRAGRWWWEDPDNKECGLHVKK
ncbi:MAG: phosphoadenylyl-sulfate reductase [Thiotrichaceae bacterium]|nr:phosphoadenylyl-sulfate reductase [Thiotrichaceae bacterium]